MPMSSRSSLPLDVAFDPAAPPRQRPHPVPALPVAALAGALAVAVAAARLGWVDQRLVRVVGVAAAHGALLTIALASADAGWRRHGATLTALLVTAALAARWRAWGAILYLAVPAALGGIARRHPSLAAVGLGPPGAWRTAMVGAAAGVLLGGHLLLSASRTFGYEMSFSPLAGYLGALAYDIGANIPSAECFFRGVLFNRAQRRWPFRSAAALATGASVVRYLVDPALPHAVETIAGALFYLTLLSAADCWLFWRSGSVVPGALAGLGFFAAYRALGGWR